MAAHTAKERQDWMNAISEATVRSGSAGASSSKGGTPVASSHKQYSSLEHTPAPVRQPGETAGSASPPEIPLLPMKAVTQAAAAEASLQVAVLDFCCASHSSGPYAFSPTQSPGYAQLQADLAFM